MAIYTRDKLGAYVGRLHVELSAAALPVETVRGPDPAGVVSVRTTRDLTPAEEQTLSEVVTAHDGSARRKRTIYAIYTELGTLSATRQNTIWADVTAGSPPKWATDAGPNAAAIAAIHWSAANSGAAAAAVNDARRRLVAMYVQDNPNYLVNPSFDQALSLAGDELDVA